MSESGVEIIKPENVTPEMQIEEIREEIASLGANDSEFSILKDILNKLNKGIINGETAVQKAREILSSKQDYR